VNTSEWSGEGWTVSVTDTGMTLAHASGAVVMASTDAARLEVRRATGAKPRLAQWLDQGEDVAMVLRIADELREASESFRHHWDLYRLLFANAPVDLAENEPDGYDHATRQAGYRTFAGEVVKSHSERLIANFLYLNGVDYVYERSYDVDVSDSTHSQYRPDFFYPGVGVWHEHWALGRDGQPPPEFMGYAEGMAWKRRVHAQHGTRLVESTWAEVMFGDGLARLKDELTRLGLTFDWNPDRPISDGRAKPMKHEDLARLVRTFMTHVKSNSWTARDLERRLGADLARLNGFRTVPAGVLADPRRVGEAARRRSQRRLRGHAGSGGRAPRSRDRGGRL
jgi:DNA helicase IV